MAHLVAALHKLAFGLDVLLQLLELEPVLLQGLLDQVLYLLRVQKGAEGSLFQQRVLADLARVLLLQLAYKVVVQDLLGGCVLRKEFTRRSQQLVILCR